MKKLFFLIITLLFILPGTEISFASNDEIEKMPFNSMKYSLTNIKPNESRMVFVKVKKENNDPVIRQSYSLSFENDGKLYQSTPQEAGLREPKYGDIQDHGTYYTFGDEFIFLNKKKIIERILRVSTSIKSGRNTLPDIYLNLDLTQGTHSNRLSYNLPFRRNSKGKNAAQPQEESSSITSYQQPSIPREPLSFEPTYIFFGDMFPIAVEINKASTTNLLITGCCGRGNSLAPLTSCEVYFGDCAATPSNAQLAPLNAEWKLTVKIPPIEDVLPFLKKLNLDGPVQIPVTLRKRHGHQGWLSSNIHWFTYLPPKLD